MIKFLFKTAFYAVVGVLLLHGVHALYVRYRDRNFDIEVETEVAHHFAQKSTAWVKDMLAEQRVKFSDPGVAETESIAVSSASAGLPERSSAAADPVSDADAHRRANRSRFKSTLRVLSQTESFLKSEEKE